MIARDGGVKSLSSKGFGSVFISKVVSPIETNSSGGSKPELDAIVYALVKRLARVWRFETYGAAFYLNRAVDTGSCLLSIVMTDLARILSEMPLYQFHLSDQLVLRN